MNYLALLMHRSRSERDISDRFAPIVHDAENGKPVQITWRGKPVAIVLSLSEYQRLTSEKFGFGAALAKIRQKYQIQALDINPDEVFNDVRDRSQAVPVHSFIRHTRVIYPEKGSSSAWITLHKPYPHSRLTLKEQAVGTQTGLTRKRRGTLSIMSSTLTSLR